MRRKILFAAAAVSAILLAVFLWRLDIPNWKKLDLDRIYAQPQSSVVYDAYGNAVGAFSTAKAREWTPLSEIPEQVRNAFLAAEDQRFYEHSGISVRRIFGALLANLRSGGYAQGASTITQQLVKLTHLTEEKTLSRKIQEIVLALQLERKLGKDDILECYLNTIYFGKGAYGIHAAAETYFDKQVEDLTLAESALLAGIIKAPSSYAPHLNPEKSLKRRDLILSEMEECGFADAKQILSAKNEPLRLNMTQTASARYGWFMDAALQEASEILFMDADEILTAGLIIETSFDPELQSAADALFEQPSCFPPDASDGTPVQAAFVAMRPETGEICAIVGGREYDVQRGLNRATQIRRSPGSAIKPVSVYAAAIDAYGFSPSSMIEDTPREFSGGYSPGNAGGNAYGTVTLREALSRSLNIATVDLADLIGVNAVRSYASRFGLSLSHSDNNLALSLGSMTHGISPAKLCAAYAALSNGGSGVEAHIIRRILNSEGKTLYEADVPKPRTVKSSTAYMLTDMLKTAAQTGSARALSSAGIPVAAKTGTVSDADGSTRDIWTAAYTPDIAVTVWMGFDSPDEEHSLSSSEGGSGFPARLCASFLKNVRTKLSGRDFVRPPEVRTALVDSLALQDDAVLLATEHTPAEYTVTELFHPDALPREYSPHWTSPDPVDDIRLISSSGETPVVQFTASDNRAEYLILRSCRDETDVIGTLTGSEGEVLRFADTGADLSETISYSVLPRHKLLYENGELLTGKESAAVTYSPGGILELLFGAGEPELTPAPADIELSDRQSMFG